MTFSAFAPIQARRQPGSAFKAFVYLAALESGQTPASVVDDSPVEFPTGRNGKPWKPDNYDRKFRGPITYQQALEESVNVAAVKVLEKNGIRRTVDLARRLGVESPLGENLSIALGTSDLSLLEITSAYGALANQGGQPHHRVGDCQGSEGKSRPQRASAAYGRRNDAYPYGQSRRGRTRHREHQ